MEPETWSRKIAQHIGVRLEGLRTERGMSRSDLADLLNVRYNAVADWEKGVRPPKLKALLLLAEVFELHSVEELLGGPFGTQTLLELRNT